MKTSFLKIQKQLLQRRLWLIAAVSVYYLLYYPVATVMLISRANERARMQALSEYRLTLQKLHTVSGWLGLRGSFLFVAALLGIVIALQGYSWLFNQEKIDFYESQPMSRKKSISWCSPPSPSCWRAMKSRGEVARCRGG